MLILFDQGVYDMRNKGNVALLEAAIARVHARWPDATLGVLTLSPHLLSLYCPDAIPIWPDGRDERQQNERRYRSLHRWIPRVAWRFMFEVREAFWRRNSASPLPIDLVAAKTHTSQVEASTVDEGRIQSAAEFEGPRRYAELVAGVDLYIATGAQYMSDACRDDALEVLNRLEAAIDHGIPTAMVGQGFGPMKDPTLVRRSRAVLPHVDLIFTRDRLASPQLLAALQVVPSQIRLTGDDAVQLAYEARTQTLGRNIGVGLRVASYTELNSDHIAVLRIALQATARKYRSRLVSIPISHSAHEMDDLVIRQLLAGSESASSDWRRFNTPVDIIKRVGGCRLVVAGTFHSLVFALAQGIPAVGIAKSVMYMDKFLGLQDHFGAGCQIVQLDDPHLEQNLGQAIEVAWSSAKQLRPVLLEAAEKQIAMGQAAYREIFELVKSRTSSDMRMQHCAEQVRQMATPRPRVSIGLPVFNAEKYLEYALTSILAQTYTDFELIVSDNASIDRTQEICLAYADQDKRIQYHRNDHNIGAAPNFNQVFMQASGEYFKWAPYDDLIAPDFLRSCVEILDNNPDIVLCYSRVKIIDENGSFVVDYDPGPDTSSPKPHERFRSLILHPEYAVQQMGLARSETLRKTALMCSFPSSDEVFLAELALHGRFYEISERLYFYRRHAEQSTQGAERTRVLFFDTSLRGKVLLPKWSYLFACLKAIRRSPLRGYDRVLCFGHVLRWMLVPPHFRAMGKDLLLAGRQSLMKAWATNR